MSADEQPSSSDAPRTLRIASSTTIRSAVTSCLSHLRQGPNAGPITLHTHSLVGGSSRTKGEGSSKTSKAAISKIGSVVEIVKREFPEYQRAAWRAEASAARLEQKAKDLKLPLRTDKGKQRESNIPDATAGSRSRRLLQIYQYNELQNLEQGRNTSDGTGEADEDVEGEAGPLTNDQADQAHLKGLADLDKVMENHVVKGRKRPLLKHTPAMLVTLSTAPLPEFVRQMNAEGREVTLQAPPKSSRARKRKRKGAKSGVQANGNASSEGDHSDDEEDYHRKIAEEGTDQTPRNTDGETLDDTAMAEDFAPNPESESLPVNPVELLSATPQANGNLQSQSATEGSNSRKRKARADEDVRQPEASIVGASLRTEEPVSASAPAAQHLQATQPLDSQISHVSESTTRTDSSVDKPFATAPDAIA